MRRPALVSLLSYAFLLSSTQSNAQSSLQALESNWQDGEQVYSKLCSYCHETDVGPALKGRQLPAVYFVSIARNGLRAMPAFREAEIDDASLQALAEFLAASDTGEGR